jgi:hypothetical protein
MPEPIEKRTWQAVELEVANQIDGTSSRLQNVTDWTLWFDTLQNEREECTGSKSQRNSHRPNLDLLPQPSEKEEGWLYAWND